MRAKEGFFIVLLKVLAWVPPAVIFMFGASLLISPPKMPSVKEVIDQISEK